MNESFVVTCLQNLFDTTQKTPMDWNISEFYGPHSDAHKKTFTLDKEKVNVKITQDFYTNYLYFTRPKVKYFIVVTKKTELGSEESPSRFEMCDVKKGKIFELCQNIVNIVESQLEQQKKSRS